MKLALMSDSLGHLGLEEMLDAAMRLGVSSIELNTGGQSRCPHARPALLLADAGARARLQAEIAARGLQLQALNAFGNPLHPQDRAQGDSLVDTLRLAGELGIDTVVTGSGLPAAHAGDDTPNWITNSWNVENQRILRYQWEEVLLPFWTGIAALARDCGVTRIALTLASNQCTHNAHTLMDLRENIGPIIGACLSPAFQFLLGACPMRVVEALGDTLFHVHATDTLLNPAVQEVTSLIDTGSVMEVGDRSWSFTTPGYGHDRDWWARFCYRLSMIDYDGAISATHQDLVLNSMDSLHKTTNLFRDVMPKDG